MTLSPGSRLGTYEILAAIGAGGMGEVFRARDTRLDRDVAIKVLPAALAQDRERLARFEREAKLLASLNHPNIAHVYGFENATMPDGSSVHFLAMELVEGEDLAERLKRGAIPLDEAIAIAKQIAEGLEEAHEHGIVHRDLKPANVKLTPNGKVKVLDFGLAKALEGDPTSSAANSQLSHSPTMSRHMTEAGMIMGTAAYMSPEQARGRAVDKRADIWSFGVVLFEMLTARRPFGGETVSEVLAAVIKDQPSWDILPADLPRSVSGVLRRCLVKEPAGRIRDIGATSWLPDGSAVVAGLFFPPTQNDIFLFPLNGEKQRPLVSLPGVEDFGQVSPNGRWLAYQSDEKGQIQVFVTSVGEPGPHFQASVRGGGVARWSPDGRFLYFVETDSVNRPGPIVAVTVSEEGERLRFGTPRQISSSLYGMFRGEFALHPDGRILAINRGRANTTEIDGAHAVLVTGWREELARLMSDRR